MSQHSLPLFRMVLLGFMALLLVQPVAFAQQPAPGQTRQQFKQDPLKKCSEVPAYKELKDARFKQAETLAAKKVPATFDKAALTSKYARYDNALCGDDGLPHLVVDGNPGDFLIPGVLFLWLAGALGWAGRSYLAESKGPEDEIMIDLPRAVKCLGLSLLWPVQAIPELISGKIRVPEDRVTVSPR